MSRLHLVFALILCGCTRSGTPPAIPIGPEPAAPEWFDDATDRLGVAFRHQAGPTDKYFLPQVMGSGVALADVDNDGRLDLILLTNAGPTSTARHALFRQQANGTFRDASAGSGLDVPGHGMGIAVGDIDNDGRVDLYISQFGGGRLFHNIGDGKFVDVTAAAGVGFPNWGTSCALFDYDRDGWLDLIVVNYVDYDPSRACVDPTGKTDFCHPLHFPGTAARLFRNLGQGKFEDATAKAGLAAARSNGLGVVCADFTGDGWPDAFVANDARPNHLWVNRANGTFADEAVTRTVAQDGAGNVLANMGVAAADLSGSGRLDLFVTHLSEEVHTLWRQDVPGRFRDATAAAGLAGPKWRGTGFGTVAADLDHDGNPDIAVANGRVSRARLASPPAPTDLPKFWHPYAERNQLFVGVGGGRFRDASTESPTFAGQFGVHRGLAWGDIDNDGAVDLVATAIEAPARILRNVAPKRGHWYGIRAYDPERKRDALGAVVTIDVGGRKRMGTVNPGQSYCSSGDPRVHFGLGAATIVDAVRVDWPDGTSELFLGGPSDAYVTITRGRGKAVKP